MGLPPERSRPGSRRGWRLRRHQREMLAAAGAGNHALLVADTGAGKTLAGFCRALAEFCLEPARPPEGLHTLYVSPLKALAHDVQRNLLTPVDEIGLPIRVETRTGDTPSDRKARQRARPPHMLLTTPESLALLLSYPGQPHDVRGSRTVVVDEVHAFATGKRGDLLALRWPGCSGSRPACAASRFRRRSPIPTPIARWLAP